MATINSWNTNNPAQVTFGGTGRATLTNHGVIVGAATAAVTQLSVGTNGQVLIGATGADPAFATITSTAGSITFTLGANTLNMEAAGGGTAWVDVTGTSASMSVNTGYVADNAGLVTLTLPATAVFGSVIRIVGKGAGGWLIAQNANQVIHFLGTDTTTGVGGSLASTVRYDCVELVCSVAGSSTEYVVRSSMGNITIV